MKTSILSLFCLTFLEMINVFGQQKEVRTIEAFSRVNLSGNVEINLIASKQPSIEIAVGKMGDLSEYMTEVRNGEFFFYHEK